MLAFFWGLYRVPQARQGLNKIIPEKLPDISSLELIPNTKVAFERQYSSVTYNPTFDIHFEGSLEVQQNCEALLWREQVDVEPNFVGTREAINCSPNFYSYEKVWTVEIIDSSHFSNQSVKYRNPKLVSYHSENFTSANVHLYGVDAELARAQIEALAAKAPWVPVTFSLGPIIAPQSDRQKKMFGGGTRQASYILDVNRPEIGLRAATKQCSIKFDQQESQKSYLISRMQRRSANLHDTEDADIGDVRCWFEVKAPAFVSGSGVLKNVKSIFSSTPKWLIL